MTVVARLLLVASLSMLLAEAPLAQEPTFIYTLRETGTLFVNGTTLEKAPSLYNFNDGDEIHGEQRYQDLAVQGADRWLLRVDGRIQMNGVKLHELPFVLAQNAPFWFRMHIDADGLAYGLRTDGMVARDGQVLATFDGLPFADLATVPVPTEGSFPDLFVLRVDGSVYRPDDEDSPGFKLDYDRDPDNPEPDGSSFDTQWVHLVYDEVSDDLFAMRADGVVMSLDPADFAPVAGASPGDGDPAPPNGALEAELPFNGTLGNFYTEFEVAPAEPAPPPGEPSTTWYALRTDGKVFSSIQAPPGPDGDWVFIVDLPGDGVNQSPYVDASSLSGGEFWCMQFNGGVYQNTSTDELFDVQGTSFARLAVSHEPPDGAKFKNRPPTAAIYKTKLVTGQPVDVPVLLSDPDKASEDLDVAFLDDKSKLPEGVDPGDLYDAATRTITFPGAGEKATYKFTIEVDDGSGKKPRRFKYPIKVLPADDNPDKNKPPLTTPIKKLTAFTGQVLTFPLVVADLDGDALTVEVIDLKGDDIFDEEFGAAFDPETLTVTWQPEFEHIGKHVAVFSVTDDGDPPRTRKLKLRINVMSQLVLGGDG